MLGIYRLKKIVDYNHSNKVIFGTAPEEPPPETFRSTYALTYDAP